MSSELSDMSLELLGSGGGLLEMGDEGGVEKFDSVYLELAFLSRVDNALSSNGFVRDGERRWDNVDAGVSVDVVEHYYDGFGEVLFDEVVFGGDSGVKRVLCPMHMPTGEFHHKGYLDHLNAMSDHIISEVIGLLRGVREDAEVGIGFLFEGWMPSVDEFLKGMAGNSHMVHYGASASEIAFGYKATQKEASAYLEKLAREGLMKKEKSGRTWVYKSLPSKYKERRPRNMANVPHKERGLQRGKVVARKEMEMIGLGTGNPEKVHAIGSLWHGAEIAPNDEADL